MDGRTGERVFEAAAHAKINLALHVTGQRDDGYHLLDTLVVFAEFGDRLTIRPASTDRLDISGPHASELAGLPPSGNLVERARDALRAAIEAAGGKAPAVAIHLDKRLPTASGMGGGSADAAAVLSLLAGCWEAFRLLDEHSLRAIAASLGADVPMCRTPFPKRAKGTGEILETVPDFPALDIVLVNPGVPVSTPAVFKALADKDNPPLPPFPADGHPGAWATWLQSTRNDLQQPAMKTQPAVGECLAALQAPGVLFSRMTGSGATCFAICRDAGAAALLRDAIAAAHPDWFTVATRTMASAMPDGETAS